MTSEEFALHYHEMKFQVELSRRTGQSFQDFFEQIMQKSDPSFMMVKVMGSEGDWKADGYSSKTQTVFQCYAPEDLTGAKAATKVRTDFDGARVRWDGKMRNWHFVWSSEKNLPPQVIAEFAAIKINHPELVIDNVSREGLWRIVKNLALSDRESLLGAVPSITDAPNTTAAEIQVLLSHLKANDGKRDQTVDFDLMAISEKIKRNGLSEAVAATIKPAIPVAHLVRQFVTAMPDPNFSTAIARDLARKYLEMAAISADPNVIFENLIEYVLGDRRLDLKLFWAAAGIVTHYFELCDIFEH